MTMSRTHRVPPKPSTCHRTGKKRWPDHRSAIAVLHRASTSRRWASANGLVSPRQEVRTYPCDACGGWHTTSRSEIGGSR